MMMCKIDLLRAMPPVGNPCICEEWDDTTRFSMREVMDEILTFGSALRSARGGHRDGGNVPLHV